ncbi:Tim10/DDP family zinc finger-domain-containing protein [Chlamydoabsidia padenii]|nr:Tim10/DDP family zinc finger-domain-containing protein [Chlamydoabsidia padenii]
MSSWTSFSQAYVNPDNLVIAEQQVDAFMELYNRIIDNCQTKCIPPHYREPDLHKGEMVCVDRCVAKYFAFQRVLGEKLQKKYPDMIPTNDIQQQQQQQQQQPFDHQQPTSFFN